VNQLRVVIAEDSALVREGLAALLERAGIAVAGRTGDLPGVLQVVAETLPDVALVDIRMPPTQTDEGLQAARLIRKRHPDTGVLVLSQYVERQYVRRLLDESPAGVGYLLKDSVQRVSDVVSYIRQVADGGTVVDPRVVRDITDSPQASARVRELTPAELRVLEHMAQGHANSAIAECLVLSRRTVENQVRTIFTKLGLAQTTEVDRRVRAVLEYLDATSA
jgi:DNA-binding NarL/FixJ family response regulator